VGSFCLSFRSTPILPLRNGLTPCLRFSLPLWKCIVLPLLIPLFPLSCRFADFLKGCSSRSFNFSFEPQPCPPSLPPFITSLAVHCHLFLLIRELRSTLPFPPLLVVGGRVKKPCLPPQYQIAFSLFLAPHFQFFFRLVGHLSYLPRKKTKPPPP